MDILEEFPLRAKNDPAWKEVIETFFEDFIHFCLPELFLLIDWKIPWQSLDTELHALSQSAEIGSRFVDKLFKVFLKDGCEQWILVHIEIQGNYYKLFAERTFESICRLHDRYKKPIVSCAILTDENPNWRPNKYEMAFAGTRLCLEFSIIKIIDYWGRISELENANNPFASVILIQLAALEAKGKSNQERYNFKMALTRRLYEKGYTKEWVIKLYYFIDWLITLPKAFEVEYKQECVELERGKNMAYVSTIEWMAMERGFEKGIQEGRQAGMQEGRREGMQEGRLEGRQEGKKEGEVTILLRLLTRKFGSVSQHDTEKVKKADTKTLLLWSEKIFEAKTIEEIFK